MKKRMNCARATQVQQNIGWLPPQNIGYTNVCHRYKGKSVITPCPQGCNCVTPARKKIWKPRVWTWFGWVGGHWVWSNPQPICVPISQHQA
jgi:hypothetical protein